MLDPSKILGGLPTTFREALMRHYKEISSNYYEGRWEPSELNAGKFCEVVYCIAKGCLDGKFPSGSSKPKDMVAACRALESLPPNPKIIGDRSLRILLPRMLLPLYEIRNNRGVGHIGGDVDPNFLDATAVYSMASWILAELIRVFHGTTTNEAQGIVDALIERKNMLVWHVDGNDMRRVLDHKMDKGDQVLLLLHGVLAWASEEDLIKWVEYSSAPLFRARILRPLHKLRLIEYDEAGSRVRISPLGIQRVEKKILKAS